MRIFTGLGMTPCQTAELIKFSSHCCRPDFGNDLNAVPVGQQHRRKGAAGIAPMADDSCNQSGTWRA
jgi:hypothetical protein